MIDNARNIRDDGIFISDEGKQFIDLFLKSICQTAPRFGEMRFSFHQGVLVNVYKEEKIKISNSKI